MSKSVRENLRGSSRFDISKVAFVSRQKLEHLNKIKTAAQREAETFSKQVVRVGDPRGADRRCGTGLMSSMASAGLPAASAEPAAGR